MAKSKRERATGAILIGIGQAFPISHPEGAEAMAVAIVDAIEIMTGKPKKAVGEDTPGTTIWKAYAEAFADRYPRAEPLDRGREDNVACARLAANLGVDRAVALARYYLTRTDAFYVQSRHPLWAMARDTHKLKTDMGLNEAISRKTAQTIETAGATLSASSAYLREKHGQRE